MVALTAEEVIRRFRAKHGDKYDYSKVKYINSRVKVTITCRTHGDFDQLPESHAKGAECPKCSKVKRRTAREFIEEAHEQHDYKYSYESLGDRLDDILLMDSIIKIYCPIHGMFEQRARLHLKGHKCPDCAQEERNEKLKRPIDELIAAFRKQHGNKYDYSLVASMYKNSQTNITIICPVHGPYDQLPCNHENGCGCPQCNESHGERIIRVYLENIGEPFETQKSFDDLYYASSKYPLRFDFYLPRRRIMIEFQGRQHYEYHGGFGTEEEFEEGLKRDQVKRDYCKNHGITLIEIPYTDNVEEVLDKIFKESGDYN